MNFTNSPLVDYTYISPFSNERTHKIDTVTVHIVVGQCTVEGLGYEFARAGKNASSNYGIGYDGRIGLYVEEKNRSWCSSSADNDDRAVTIEVASDTKAPYKVTDAAYKSLIRLLADICKRNGIPKLLWQGDKSLIGQIDKQNMTVHKWFANKDCPGQYLYERHGDIAKRVNSILAGEEEEEMRYNTLADLKADKEYGSAYLPTIEKLIKNGYLKGKGGKGDGLVIDLSADAVRLLVILDRAGNFK